MIDQLHHDQPAMNIREACQTLGVSPAGYYAHRHKDQRSRRAGDAVLSPKITAAFDASRHTYGSPRIMHALRGEGARHGKNRIARLMRSLGLHVQQKRRYVPRTTIADKTSPVSPNLLLELPEVTRLNEVWLTDITYIPTAEGFLYLAAELDLYSRRIIGWSTHSSLATGLATGALERALQARPEAPLAELVHHSDQGCQYTSAVFRKRLELSAIAQSMSRKGNCYDNAAMECCFAPPHGAHPFGAACRLAVSLRSALGHAQSRVLRLHNPRHPRSSPPHDLRLHRDLLQPPAPPQRTGLPVACELREIHPTQLTLFSVSAFSKKDHE
jgi:putative transposase